MKIITKIDGILRVAWVEDILLDNGAFVGYMMPIASTPYKIFRIAKANRVDIFPKSHGSILFNMLTLCLGLYGIFT